MDPKTAACLEEIDMLRMTNIALRRQIVESEYASLVRALVDKYAAAGEALTVDQTTGAIVRAPAGGIPSP